MAPQLLRRKILAARPLRFPTPWLALLALACTSQQVPSTQPTDPATHDFRRVELYFGLSSDDQSGVSEQEWTSYVTETLAPGFHQGFTVHSSEGQWEDPQGRVVLEASRVAVYFFEASHEAEVREVVGKMAARYKERFDMQTILVAWSDADVDFL